MDICNHENIIEIRTQCLYTHDKHLTAEIKKPFSDYCLMGFITDLHGG